MHYENKSLTKTRYLLSWLIHSHLHLSLMHGYLLSCMQIVEKAESLRKRADDACGTQEEKVEMYRAALESAQEKLKHAASEITRGNDVCY